MPTGLHDPDHAPGRTLVVCLTLLAMVVAFLVGALIGGDPTDHRAAAPQSSRWV